MRTCLLTLLLFVVSQTAYSQAVSYTGQQSTSEYATSSDINTPVTADLGMTFTIPKTVALSVHDGTGISNHPIFQGYTPPIPSNLAIEYDGSFGANGATNQEFVVSTAIYTNTTGNILQTFDFDNTVLVHQNGASFGSIDLHKSTPTSRFEVYFDNTFFVSGTLTTGQYTWNWGNNLLNFYTPSRTYSLVYKFRVDANTIDMNVDRAGNYYGYGTVTLTTP